MTLTLLANPLSHPISGSLKGSQAARTAGHVLRESRPAVQLVFLIRVCVAAGLPFQFSLRAGGVIAGWSMLTVAVYVFNGVTDRAGDQVNGSSRPIATGALAPDTAVRAAGLLGLAGTLVCALIEPWTLPIALAFLALGWAYSTGPALKNTPDGFAAVIAGGAALTYAAGWLAGGALDPAQLGFGPAMALWVGLACAAKDFSDVDGDRLAGRRTWPVLLGAQRAARCLAASALAGALVMVALAVLVWSALLPVALVIVVGSLLLGDACRRQATEAARSARRRPYRVFVSTQHSAHAAFVVSGALG